jgi:hypothetical protein
MHGVGELGKNLSPSKRRSCRIRRYIREYVKRVIVLFRGKKKLIKVLCYFYKIRWLSNTVQKNCRIGIALQVCFLFQDDWNWAILGIMKLWALGSLRNLFSVEDPEAQSEILMSDDFHEW